MSTTPMQTHPTTADAIEALRADHQAALDIVAAMPADAWAAPSGCPGWTVKDLVAHLATVFWRVVDPSSLPDNEQVATEEAQERDVATRASWSPEQVLADYVDVAAQAFPRLEWLGEQPDLMIPLGDLGTYPAPSVVWAFNFDHYTHVRADLLAPRGPLDQAPPASDHLRMAPAVAWILAALPQQCAATLHRLPGPVELLLSGAAGGRVVLDPSGAVTADSGTTQAVASISCTTADLVWWSTGRATWAERAVETSGNPAALALMRDGIHVF